MTRTVDYGDLNGLVVYFIVGTYNKGAVLSTYFLVLYDIDNSELLFMKKYSAKPGGFGFKNYWARTYYEVLLQVEKDMKKKWSKGKT